MGDHCKGTVFVPCTNCIMYMCVQYSHSTTSVCVYVCVCVRPPQHHAHAYSPPAPPPHRSNTTMSWERQT